MSRESPACAVSLSRWRRRRLDGEHGAAHASRLSAEMVQHAPAEQVAACACYLIGFRDCAALGAAGSDSSRFTPQ